MADQQSESLNIATLELVYAESKEAHSRLLTDIGELKQTAEKQTQISFLLVGVFVTIIGAIVSSSPLYDQLNRILAVMVIAVVMLLLSIFLSAYIQAPLKFYAGTVYPHVLEEELIQTPETTPVIVKQQLLRLLSESYYHNLKKLERQSWVLFISSVLQLGAIITPIILSIREVAI